MKISAIPALAALFAIAFAAPADAAKAKKRLPAAAAAGATGVAAANYGYMPGKVPPHLRSPNGVYGADGEVIGMDPDPHIRLQMLRDPKPWGDR